LITLSSTLASSWVAQTLTVPVAGAVPTGFAAAVAAVV
jgi:hypothetical protein